MEQGPGIEPERKPSSVVQKLVENVVINSSIIDQELSEGNLNQQAALALHANSFITIAEAKVLHDPNSLQPIDLRQSILPVPVRGTRSIQSDSEQDVQIEVRIDFDNDTRSLKAFVVDEKSGDAVDAKIGELSIATKVMPDHTNVQVIIAGAEDQEKAISSWNTLLDDATHTLAEEFHYGK